MEKRKKQLQPVYTFSLLLEGQNMLRKLVREYRLCPKLCLIQKDNDVCIGLTELYCDGACEQRESPDSYNERVEAAIAALVKSLPSFTLMDEGRHPEEKSCILIEQGRLYGMGYLPTDAAIGDAEELKNYLTRYPENDYMRGLIYQHAEKWPAKKINWVQKNRPDNSQDRYFVKGLKKNLFSSAAKEEAYFKTQVAVLCLNGKIVDRSVDQ